MGGGSGGGGGGSGGRAGGGSGGDRAGEGGGGSAGGGSGGAAGQDAGSPGGDAAGGAPSAEEDCTATPNSLLCNPLAPMPPSIKGTGFFPAAPDLNTHSSRMIEYVPDPPLWSDGMEKQRFLVLPKDEKIDNADRKKWEFPEGTIFIKSFFDDSGQGGEPRAIETRFIRAGENGQFEFYLYKWNPEGTDAELLVNDIEGDVNMSYPVSVTINHMEGGKPLVVNDGKAFDHTLPSRQMCGDCHEENAMVAQTFIGFDELRLNSKFPTDAPKTQLETLADTGIFTMPIPSDPAAITDDDPRMLRIKRFVFGNCVHCHSSSGAQVDFSPEVFVENTVGKATEAQSVVPPPGWLRIVPGKPENSVVYVQVERVNIPPPMGDAERLRPMPPVGVEDVAVPQDALQDLREWIMSLQP